MNLRTLVAQVGVSMLGKMFSTTRLPARDAAVTSLRSADEVRVKSRLVERRLRAIRRVDDLRVLRGSEIDEAMEDILRLMMLAVHVQQHARPDSAGLKVFIEQLDPGRFDEEEVQPRLGTQALDLVDEVVICVQRVRHREVVDPSHALTLGRDCGVSMKVVGRAGDNGDSRGRRASFHAF